MFRKWLLENKASDFVFSGTVLEKASNREYWNTQYKKEYIQNAEKYLGYEWPIIRATDYIAFNTEGNRKKQETPHFAKRTALIALLFGEVLEYEGRFIPDIVDGVYSICEESFWGVSAHYCSGTHHPKLPFNDHYIDLFAAETGALIATAVYLLGDRLYEFWSESVERAEYNLNERIVKPYLNHKDFWWMAYDREKVNNWNPWIISNLLTVFLLTQQKNERFFQAVERMLYQINVFYSGYSDDGGCEEGITYWGVSGVRLLDFCNMLKLATNGKINFFNDKKIIKMGEYPYKTYIGNSYYVNFADGGCKGGVLRNSHLYNCGGLIKNQNLRAIAMQSQNEPLLYTDRILDAVGLFEFFKQPPESYDFKLPDGECFPVLQNAFAREGKWYYAAKGGHNREHHNHNDVGSFIVYHNLKPLLIDVGVGVYTKNTFLATERYKIWTMRSDWHNLPTVNGSHQQFGCDYRADCFEYDNKKCKISFKDAYDKEADLKSLTREIDISDVGINLHDQFVFNKADNSVCEHFVTPMTVEIKDGKAIIGKKFILSADTQAETEVEKQDFNGDERLTESWDTDCVYRITFKLSADDRLNVKFTLRKI